MKGNKFSHEVCRECIYRNTVHHVSPCKNCGKDNEYKFITPFNSGDDKDKD